MASPPFDRLILAIVAVILIIESRNLLIGESAYRKREGIYEIVNGDDDVYVATLPCKWDLKKYC
jgi:hypothetical protein